MRLTIPRATIRALFRCMQIYTQPELEALLAGGESDLVERKSSWEGDAPEKGRQAICAFANDLPGHGRCGVLFVGANDDGTPSHLTISDRLLLTLADIKTDGNLLPPPTLIVQNVVLGGTSMAVVQVAPALSPPVTYKGRIWVRVGPRRAIASAQDERVLNERRRHRAPSFDAQVVPQASLADLDRILFERTYLPAAFAPDVLAANERTYEQRLAATKMIASVDEPAPTVTGLLTLGHRPRDFVPGAYVQFLRILGTALADPIQDEAVFDGPIVEVLRALDGKLASHNRTSIDITSGAVEQRTSDYPLAALQQLVRNAVMHRTYEQTNAPVRVVWFDDRIEIGSPGGPFGVVTAATFGEPGVVDYRNPLFAEAMKVLGYVQRFGVGIATARAGLAKNGNPPPEFSVQPNWVHCTVRRRQAR